MRPDIRALVLAAGFGTRLRPLTEELPKPLLPVLGQPLIAHTLDRLAGVGCTKVALNLHYQGEKIRETFGASHQGMDLVYSREEEILGTLGALAPLREFFRGADVALLINGDSLCRWPLSALLRAHRKHKSRATLLLAKRPDAGRYGGGVGIDEGGRVVSFRKGGPKAGAAKRRYVFAGAHALSPDLLESVEEHPTDIVRDLYEPMLVAGSRIGALPIRRRWHDLGTPRRYLDGLLDWARGPRPWSRSWISPQAEVLTRAKVQGSVVEEGARVGPRAVVRASLVLPGATVGRAARLEGAIIGHGVRLPEGARVQACLVTRQISGAPLPPRSSIVDGLVYTPIGSAEGKGGTEKR